MKSNTNMLLLAMLLVFVSMSCNSQSIHPYKKDFADFKSWKPTLPTDIDFKNFRPYRAVYNRSYVSAAHGKTANDQVIMIAQRVYWYGKTVILFEYHDAGTPEFDDTNARTQFYYLDEKTLQLHLAVGPKAGTPEDYTTVRVLDDKISTSKVNTATGEVEFSTLENKDPTFGFRQLRFLPWAAMDLKVGDKTMLRPFFNPPGGNLAGALGIVKEQVDYTTPDNKKYKSFVVDDTNDPTSAIVNKFFIVNEAPYLLAQGLYNADDDEIYRWWLKLDSFQYLDGK